MKPMMMGAAVAGVLVSVSGLASAQPARSPAKPSGAGLAMPELQHFTLPNGLEVAFLHHDAAPVVAVEVWYHVGSKDEARDRRGSAHMFEHIMFKGTEHVRPEEHARFVSGVGGLANAHTTEDATTFLQVVPAPYLDFVLQLEADRMRHLLFRDDMIATEREVVKEEIRQRENDPITMGLLHFLSIAYTKHPYAWTSGGDIAGLDHTSTADLKAFYDTYYQPSNALLVVVGATTLDEVKALATKYFGAIPAGATPPRPADLAPEPPQTAKRREVVDGGQVGIVFAGFKIPAAKDPDIYALQLLSLVMGGGESSRLRQRIKAADPKTKKTLGVEAASPILIHEHPGMFLCIGVYRDPKGTDAIEAAIFDELAKVAKKPPSRDELRKAKNIIQSTFVFGLDSPLGIAEQIGESWILTGDPGQWLRDLDAIEQVTAADLARVAATYLVPDKATVVIVPPKGAPQ